ncbi:MAG: zinc ribbon domain-containing protein [Myxococcales bacterium]|nr:zinc ribbon domain-containing protein [Myxococcales bacterium]
MAGETMICSVCGATNQADNTRCESCGARLDAISQVELSAEEAEARRYQQDSFAWKWVVFALGWDLVVGAIVLVALPFVLPTYDPQGVWGLLIAAGIWTLGAVIVGFLSPNKTFIEPTVAALIALPPTMAYLASIADVYKLSTMSYIIGGLIGVMLALMGAFVGEFVQARR